MCLRISPSRTPGNARQLGGRRHPTQIPSEPEDINSIIAFHHPVQTLSHTLSLISNDSEYLPDGSKGAVVNPMFVSGGTGVEPGQVNPGHRYLRGWEGRKYLVNITRTDDNTGRPRCPRVQRRKLRGKLNSRQRCSGSVTKGPELFYLTCKSNYLQLI